MTRQSGEHPSGALKRVAPRRSRAKSPAMTFLRGFDGRVWLPVLLGASACQVPGEDWVAATEVTSTSMGNSATSTLTVGGPATMTSATAVASDSDATTETSTSAGGASSTSDGGSTSGSTSDSVAAITTDAGGGSTTASASDTSSTTGTGGTGGVPEGSLIENGDFSAGETGWELEGDGSVNVSDGEYCMTLDSAGTLHLDWPTEFEPASLEAGASYVFSYVVYYSGEEPTVSVKLGQPVDPYNAFAEGEIDASTSPTTFMQAFDVDADDRAGIRFTIEGPSGSEVCIDNVALLRRS